MIELTSFLLLQVNQKFEALLFILNICNKKLMEYKDPIVLKSICKGYFT